MSVGALVAMAALHEWSGKYPCPSGLKQRCQPENDLIPT
jgi:hypothetical protein